MSAMDERKYSLELQQLSRDYADDIVPQEEYRRMRSRLLDAFEAELSVSRGSAGSHVLHIDALKPKRLPLYGVLIGLLVVLGAAASLIFWLL